MISPGKYFSHFSRGFPGSSSSFLWSPMATAFPSIPTCLPPDQAFRNAKLTAALPVFIPPFNIFSFATNRIKSELPRIAHTAIPSPYSNRAPTQRHTHTDTQTHPCHPMPLPNSYSVLQAYRLPSRLPDKSVEPLFRMF